MVSLVLTALFDSKISHHQLYLTLKKIVITAYNN